MGGPAEDAHGPVVDVPGTRPTHQLAANGDHSRSIFYTSIHGWEHAYYIIQTAARGGGEWGAGEAGSWFAMHSLRSGPSTTKEKVHQRHGQHEAFRVAVGIFG